MGRLAGFVACAAWLLLAAASASAHPPSGLVADAGGNVYFSDLETVWRLAPDGRLSVFRPSDGAHVHELVPAEGGAVEGEINRYEPGTQTWRAGIWRRTADGRETWPLPETDAPPKGFGLWRDRAGNRHLAQWVGHDDRRTLLLRRSPDGKVDLLYGPRAEGARFRQILVSSVGGMAFGADGSLVFADGRALRRIAPDGAATLLFEGPEGTHLRGVAAAPDGRMLVADLGRGLVLAVAGDGKVETLYRSGAGWKASAALFRGGRLIVLEANSDPYDYDDRVRLVEVAGGKARVVAQPGRGEPPVPQARRPGGGNTAFVAAIGAVVALALALALWRRRSA